MSSKSTGQLLIAFSFIFILFSSSFPLTNMYDVFAYPTYPKEEKIELEELPVDFNEPTDDSPWPQEIISEDFALRDACLDGDRIPDDLLAKFDISLIEIDIVYNAFGQHDPNGVMYVLDENKEMVKEKVRNNPGKTVSEVEPLTIRSNIGQCVEIVFTNDLKANYASIHPTGPSLNPNDDDGTFVGLNDDTTVQPGETTVYRWFPDVEGAYFFTDAARQANQLDPAILGEWAESERGTLRQSGAFGSLIVEASGATWTDPYTGEPLKSGAKAVIHYPDDIRADTREFAVYYHDDSGVLNSDGTEPTDEKGEENSLYTMNYRGDTLGSRLDPTNCPEGVDLEVCISPKYFYSSWPHGDPGGGDLVFPTYSGDPVRFIVIGANTEENHVHHLHEHRWKADPSNQNSFTIDSQTVAPGVQYQQPVNLGFGDFTVRPDNTYSVSLIAGSSGYQPGDPADQHFTGDVLFHCHLFPHYGNGMWSLMRVLDRVTTPFPDLIIDPITHERTLVPSDSPVLLPLDNDPQNDDIIPIATEDQPGYPYFIPADTDGAPLYPPNPNANPGIQTGDILQRQYSESEWMATNYFDRDPDLNTNPPGNGAAPGGPYDNPCPPDAKVRHYDVTAISKDIVYNQFRDHDPFGRMYVLEQEKFDVLTNLKEEVPLVLRAELGECVEIALKNEIGFGYPNLGISPALRTEGISIKDVIENELSMHIHFVAFDVLGSDGPTVGYNYAQHTEPGEIINYRWYADEEGTIYWHDHTNGITQGMHGTGGLIVVEPKDSRWLNPENGNDLDQTPGEFPTGEQIVVVPENEGDFEPYREFIVLLQDFVELFDKDGDPINMRAENLNTGVLLNEKAHPQASLHDHGAMSINYRNEPLYQRMEEAINDGIPWNDDPAYIFTSAGHGDPSTPIFKSFANENVKIRLLQLGHEEQHNLVVNGMDMKGTPPNTPPSLGLQGQTIGTSEQFTFDMTTPTAATDRTDYMYSSRATNDLVMGMWGLIRVWCDENTLANDPIFGTDTDHEVKLEPLQSGMQNIDCGTEQNIQNNINNQENNGDNNAFVGANTDEHGFKPISSDSLDNVNSNTQKIQYATLAKYSERYSDSNSVGISQERESHTGHENEFDDIDVIRDPPAFLIDPPIESPLAGPVGNTQLIDPPIESPLTGPPGDNQRAISSEPSQPLSELRQLVEENPPPTTVPAMPDLKPVPLNELDLNPSSCPDNAPIREYNIAAIQKDIVFNDNGDFTSPGIAFVLKEDVAAINAGDKELEPLVIRANLGECVIINLENLMPNIPIPHHDHPLQPGECNEHIEVACLRPELWNTSLEVSLNPTKVIRDVSGFDGTNMGFNPVKQTIGPGEMITYEWFAQKTGTNVLTDFGDIRGHRHHGGFGLLIVEPFGAQYLDINTQQPIKSGSAADIVFADDPTKNFREFTLAFADSMFIESPTGLCILPGEAEGEHPPLPGEVPEPPEIVACNQEPVDDPEDQGFPSINYASEPFIWRLLTDEDIQRLIDEQQNMMVANNEDQENMMQQNNNMLQVSDNTKSQLSNNIPNIPSQFVPINPEITNEEPRVDAIPLRPEITNEEPRVDAIPLRPEITNEEPPVDAIPLTQYATLGEDYSQYSDTYNYDYSYENNEYANSHDDYEYGYEETNNEYGEKDNEYDYYEKYYNEYTPEQRYVYEGGELEEEDVLDQDDINRLQVSKLLSQLQSSRIHGDPDTPVMKAEEGTPIVLRVADVGDSPRGIAFHLAGHSFLRPAPISLDDSELAKINNFDPFIDFGTAHALTTGRSHDIQLIGDAGGLQDKTGDYLYQDMKLRKYVEGGAWGFLRVFSSELGNPIDEIKELIYDIEYSKLPTFDKEGLISNLYLILDMIREDNDTTNACDDVLAKLLQSLDTRIEHENNQNTHYGYAESYDKYGKDYGYQDEYKQDYGYPDDYKQNSELEIIKERIQEIGYKLC